MCCHYLFYFQTIGNHQLYIMSITIHYSTITGIHRTQVSSHKDMLRVEMDHSIPHIDPEDPGIKGKVYWSTKPDSSQPKQTLLEATKPD